MPELFLVVYYQNGQQQRKSYSNRDDACKFACDTSKENHCIVSVVDRDTLSLYNHFDSGKGVKVC